MALLRQPVPIDGFPPLQPPQWTEDVYSRAIHFLSSQSSAKSFILSHADIAATIACVARAGLFVENQQPQVSSPLESTQSVDMSIVTISSATAFDSAHFSPQSASAQRFSDSNLDAFAFSSPHSAESPFIYSGNPAPTSASSDLEALSVGIFDHGKSSIEGPATWMSLQSFTFSPPFSPSWANADDGALQSLHHHHAHLPSLLNLLRNYWASRISGRHCLLSEETAVVASFIQIYPFPSTCAPDWEVSEFCGNACY
jgi:hypothetical protein